MKAIQYRRFMHASLLVTALLAARILFYRLYPVAILSIVSNGLILNALVILLLVNVALFSLIGEFTIRTFFQQKGTPLYIVREKLSR